MMPTSTISISPLREEDIPGAVDAIQVSSGGKPPRIILDHLKVSL
jgi:hypothetical protein